MTLHIKKNPGKVGIFGYYRSLTVSFEEPIKKNKRVWAQDLSSDQAVDITSEVQQKGNCLIFPGELIQKIGLSNATDGDVSDPAIVVEIRDKKTKMN